MDRTPTNDPEPKVASDWEQDPADFEDKLPPELAEADKLFPASIETSTALGGVNK